MAHIINPISVKPRTTKNPLKKLSCIHNCQITEIHDTNAINENIKKAAKINQQLQKDIFERDNIIQGSINAAKNL